MVVKRNVVSEQDGRNNKKPTVSSSESGNFTPLYDGLASSADSIADAPVSLDRDSGSMDSDSPTKVESDSILELMKETYKDPKAVSPKLREAMNRWDEDDAVEEQKEVKELKRRLKKIATNLVRGWSVEAIRGEDRSIGQEVFGVKITSKMYEHPPIILTLDCLEEKPEQVIRTLRNNGSFRPGDYELLVEYVRLLIDEQQVTRVDSLSDQLNDCLPEVEARKLFDFMIVKVIENLTFFPKLSSAKTTLDFAQNPDMHYGVQLDTNEYVDRFSLDLTTGDVVAFGVTTRFLKEIFELTSHKVVRFKKMIRSWRAYGLLSPLATYNDGHIQKIQIGGTQRGLYLFRVHDYTRRKEAVKARMKVPKHAE